MTYLETIKKAHALVCQARNLLNEAASDMSTDIDVHTEVDQVFTDWGTDLENVEDQLFTGCNVKDINDLVKELEVGDDQTVTVTDWRDGIVKTVYKGDN
jgi:hypothetical protein